MKKAEEKISDKEEKIKEKKVKKCASLFAKHKQKNYKKFQLLKTFDEDYALNNKDGDKFVEYQSKLAKFKKLRVYQYEKDSKHMQNQEQDETLHSVLSDIREEFFSDLNPEEIPNSDISDVSESEIVQEGEQMLKQMEAEVTIDSKIEMVKK